MIVRCIALLTVLACASCVQSPHASSDPRLVRAARSMSSPGMRQLHHSLQVSISPLAGEPGFPIALTSEGGSIWYLRSDSRGTIVARLDDRGLIAEQYRIRARAQTFLVE